jgi:hypothetical protein
MPRLSRPKMEAAIAVLLPPGDARQFLAAADRALIGYWAVVAAPYETPQMRTAADRLLGATVKLSEVIDDAPRHLEAFARQGAFIDGRPPVEFRELRDTLERLATDLRFIRLDVPELTGVQYKNDARNRLIATLAREFTQITKRPAGIGPKTIFHRALAAVLAHDGPHLGHDTPDYSDWIRQATRQG